VPEDGKRFKSLKASICARKSNMTPEQYRENGESG